MPDKTYITGLAYYEPFGFLDRIQDSMIKKRRTSQKDVDDIFRALVRCKLLITHAEFVKRLMWRICK